MRTRGEQGVGRRAAGRMVTGGGGVGRGRAGGARGDEGEVAGDEGEVAGDEGGEALGKYFLFSLFLKEEEATALKKPRP